jgi:hypothetical protein
MLPMGSEIICEKISPEMYAFSTPFTSLHQFLPSSEYDGHPFASRYSGHLRIRLSSAYSPSGMMLYYELVLSLEYIILYSKCFCFAFALADEITDLSDQTRDSDPLLRNVTLVIDVLDSGSM